MALHSIFPELDMEEERGVGRLSYPRPISEPPSPTSSRATTPIPSDQSDDENDEVDEEREVSNVFSYCKSCEIILLIFSPVFSFTNWVLTATRESNEMARKLRQHRFTP